MLSKYFTIVVIPQKTSKVTKFKIPVNLFTLVVLLLIGMLVVLFWMTINYFSIQTKAFNLVEIRNEYHENQEQIDRYKEKIHDFELELDRLSELNYKLRVLTSLEVPHAVKKLTEEEKLLLKKQTSLAKKGILEIITSSTEENKVKDDLGQKKFNLLFQFLEERKNLYSRIPSQWPVKGLLIAGFGYRSDPFSGQIKPNNDGIDIAPRHLYPIVAPANGIVIYIGDDETYGNLMILDHGNGILTRYGHLPSFEVGEGSIVNKGDTIGKVGSSGNSNESLLHYEVLSYGIPQNPIGFIQEE